MSTRFKFINGEGKYLMSLHLEGDRFTANFTEMEQFAATVKKAKNARIIGQLLGAAGSPVVMREEVADSDV